MGSPEGDHARPHTRSLWPESVCMSSIAALSAMAPPLLSRLQWRTAVAIQQCMRYLVCRCSTLECLDLSRSDCIVVVVRGKTDMVLSVFDGVTQASQSNSETEGLREAMEMFIQRCYTV